MESTGPDLPTDYEAIFHLDPDYSDGRGTIWNVVDAVKRLVEVEVSHVAVITSRVGSIRANHWHPLGAEQLMFLAFGEYMSFSRPHGGGEVHTLRVLPGDLVYTPPLVDHAYRFDRDSVFLNLTPIPRDRAGYGTVHTFPLEGKDRLL